MTPKQKKFADKYLETGNGTKAALETYDTESENMAAVIASKNIRKDKIQEYLADKAERASQVIFELLENADNETVRLNAGKDILDRAGFKPMDRTDITTKGQPMITLSSVIAKKNGLDSTTD